MDVLSEVLKSVTLKGAVFYNAEFSAPWSFRSPASHLVAQHLGAAPAHVIIYHLLIEGAAWAEAAGVQRVDLAPGDIVVFPHGDPHIMGNGPPVAPVDNGQELGRILSQGLAIARMGGGGAITRLVCGYMTCEPEAIRRILAGLPPLLTVNIRQDPSGAWLENSILFSVANAGSSSAGAEAVLARLSEALFIETLRRYAASLPASGTGWLAGARDPEVGKALGLLHSHPARAWTIEDLARSVGVSRAVLAGRFRHFLGEPPIGYLTRWRLQLAARLLTTTSHNVAQIAAQAGYESEAAFNRAFKRMFGAPPARFRRERAAPSPATLDDR
ncbi:MAG: AraC family transcriptional regulator [Acidobacteriota bacterium]